MQNSKKSSMISKYKITELRYLMVAIYFVNIKLSLTDILTLYECFVINSHLKSRKIWSIDLRVSENIHYRHDKRKTGDNDISENLVWDCAYLT